MNKFKQLFSNTVIFALGNFLSKIVLLILMPLYTSALNTEQYGISELINNSIELILPIATLCITDAVFRFSIDAEYNKKELFNNGVLIVFRGTLVLTIIILISSVWIKSIYLVYFGILFFTNAFRQLFAQFTRGIGYVKEFAISGVISAISLVTFNIIFLIKFNWGINGYLLAMVFSNVIPTIYLIFKVKLYKYIEYSNKNKELLKNMLIYSIPNVPNMLSWWINNISSRYIIILFCGVGTAGLFSAASKMPSMINLLSTIFQQAWQYSSAKEYGNNDSEKFYTEIFELYSSFVLISASIVLICTPIISKFILKGEFYNGWIYSPILIVASTIGCYSSFFGTFYMAAKKNVMGMYSTIIGAASNLIISLILIPIVGVYGALVAAVISYLIIVIIRIITIKRYVKIKVDYLNLFSGLLVLLTQAITLTIRIKNYLILNYVFLIIIIFINIRKIVRIISIFLNMRK